MRILILLAVTLLTACEPMGMFPGNQLSGEPAEHPDDWSTLNEAEVIQIGTYDNYSVNLWGVGLSRGYYIASARGKESRWAQRLAKNPKVTLRIDGMLYTGIAVTVTDEAELAETKTAFESKYDLEPDEDFPEALVFRIESE